MAHIIAQFIDKKGNNITSEDAEITFSVDGNVRVLVVHNGSNRGTQNYQSNTVLQRMVRLYY